MHDMFEVLSGFEDCGRDKKGRLPDPTDNQRVKEALLKAIVIFGEAFRFRSIYLSVRARIQDDEDSSELDGSLWILLHDWGLFSSELLPPSATRGRCQRCIPLPQLLFTTLE